MKTHFELLFLEMLILIEVFTFKMSGAGAAVTGTFFPGAEPPSFLNGARVAAGATMLTWSWSRSMDRPRFF